MSAIRKGLSLWQWSAIAVFTTVSCLESTTPKCIDLYKDADHPKVWNAANIGAYTDVPGVVQTTLLGGKDHGAKDLEIWLQTMAPGTSIPPHTHAAEEWIMALQGEVMFTSRDAGLTVMQQMLRVNDTVTVLPGVLHAFSNTGHADVQLLVALGKPPPEIMIVPSWESSLNEAFAGHPWPASCPPTLPESLLPLYESGGKDEL